MKKQLIYCVALACVICGCGKKNAQPPVAAADKAQPTVTSPATPPSIPESNSKKPVPVKLSEVFTIESLMNRITTNLFTLSDEGGWDKFTMPKVQKWVSENLYGKRGRIIVGVIQCNVAQDEADPKPDEWIVRFQVTSRHANYAGLGNRLLPISNEQGVHKEIGKANFMLKCTEAEARKWDAHAKTPSPSVMIEGDVVEISFEPRLIGKFNNFFIGYNTFVKLESVAMTPSKDAEPVAQFIMDFENEGKYSDIRDAIIEVKRLDSSSSNDFLFVKTVHLSQRNEMRITQEIVSFKSDINDGKLQHTPCDDPPSESQISEAIKKASSPKSDQ